MINVSNKPLSQSEVVMGIESTVKPYYEGHCSVLFKGKNSYSTAVFPNFFEAYKVATISLVPDIGGYYGATLSETLDPVTHESLDDWLFT